MSGDLVPFKDIKDHSKAPQPPKPANDHDMGPFGYVLMIIFALLVFGMFTVIAMVMK